jgi:hypothetical protein
LERWREASDNFLRLVLAFMRGSGSLLGALGFGLGSMDFCTCVHTKMRWVTLSILDGVVFFLFVSASVYEVYKESKSFGLYNTTRFVRLGAGRLFP